MLERVARAIEGRRGVPGAKEGEALPADLKVGDEVADDLRGHEAVELLCIGLLVVELTAQDEILDDELGEVHAAERHIPGVRAGTDVDLEELELAVALVVLRVEVGKPPIPHVLAEALCVVDKLLGALEQNAGGVADARRRVVLEHNLAARDRSHAPALDRVRGQRADRVVVAGDEVLDHELLVVARLMEQVENATQVSGVLDGVDLLFARKRHRVVARRVGRLGDQGEREALGVKLGVRVGAVEELRGGVRHAELLADGVEAALLRDVVKKREVVVRDDEPLLELLLVLGDGAHVPVGAAKKNSNLAGLREL